MPKKDAADKAAGSNAKDIALNDASKESVGRKLATEKLVAIAGTKAAAKEKVAAVIKAAPKQRKKQHLSLLKNVSHILADHPQGA